MLRRTTDFTDDAGQSWTLTYIVEGKDGPELVAVALNGPGHTLMEVPFPFIGPLLMDWMRDAVERDWDEDRAGSRESARAA